MFWWPPVAADGTLVKKVGAAEAAEAAMTAAGGLEAAMGRGWLGSMTPWSCAADMGTGCVGRVMDVVLQGEVAGMEILGLEGFCSSSTCFVVLISDGGMGWVGSCTSDRAGCGLGAACGAGCC